MKLRAIALILTLALGLLVTPLAVEAQDAGKMHRIGNLRSARSYRVVVPLSYLQLMPGYILGETFVFEGRSAVRGDDQLPALAADLVRQEVDVILAYGAPATRAAKDATRTIPILALLRSDPVRAGLVASFARPGGNITGVTTLVPELIGKRLQLLKEAVPRVTRVAVLWNPDDPEIDEEWQQTQAAARALGLELHSVEVRSRDHLKSAVEAAVRHQADGLLVLADRLTWNYAYTIADLATKAGVPAMFSARHSADRMNGFMSYGADPVSLGQRAATLLDKILKGAKPADLPFEQPTTLELVINLKTAKALSLKIPPSVLIRADKVIQ